MGFFSSLTFAETCYNGEFRWVHAGAHEEDEVLVSSLAECGHVQPEGLEGGLVVQVLRVKDLDGDVAVPVSLVY